MKRILSVFIAVIMLTGLLPVGAVAAAGNEPETLNFVFSAAAHNVAVETQIAQVKSFETIVDSVSEPWYCADTRSVAHGKTLTGGFYAAVASDDTSLGKNGILFKIKVDGNGFYKPVLKYQRHNTGGKLLAFIVSANDSSFTPSSSGMKVLAESGTPLGAAIDTYRSGVSNMNFADADVVEYEYNDAIELSEGEYYLMFALDGCSHDGAGYMLIQSLSFEKVVSAKENKYVFSRKALGESGAVNVVGNGRDYDKINPEESSPWKNVAIRYMNGGKYTDNGMYVHIKNGKTENESDHAVFPNNGLAYKIKVDENGVYAPSVTYSKYSKGG
ncbi:MAG: hypothetical protein IKY53_08285, partial [Lachnospiraceae bacterium]|nr:hypothetical protein [Lachnospiraceae bacterium]